MELSSHMITTNQIVLVTLVCALVVVGLHNTELQVRGKFSIYPWVVIGGVDANPMHSMTDLLRRNMKCCMLLVFIMNSQDKGFSEKVKAVIGY